MKTLTIPTIYTAIDKVTGPMMKMQAAVSNFGTKAEASMARAERSTRKFMGVADSIQGKLFNLQNAAVALFAVMAVKTGFNMVEQVAERGDDIAKTAKQIGISTTALQELEFAAERENVSMETLRGSLTKMNKAVGELQRGQGDLYSTLKKTDPALLSQLQKVTKSEDAFALLSEAVMKAPNAMQKAALATKAFGRSGQEMLKFLEVGPEGIRALAAEAHRLGLVMDDELLKKAAQFDDANVDMKKAIYGAKLAIGGGLLPSMTELITKTTDYIVKNRELIAQKAEAIFDKVRSAITYLSEHGETLIKTIVKVTAGFIILKGVILLAQAAMIAMKIAMFSYNVILGITNALQGRSAFYVMGNTVAYNAYRVAVVATTAVQSAWNAVLSKGRALMAALTMPMWGIVAVIGVIILLFMSFRRNWDMIIKAFKTDGILGGLKAIGATLLDTVLWPLQKILEIAGKLPGKMGEMARNAAGSIEKFRGNMGIDVTDGTGASAAAPAANPRAAQVEATASRIEKTTNKNVTVDFKNLPAGTSVSGDGVSNSLMPFTSKTFAFG